MNCIPVWVLSPTINFELIVQAKVQNLNHKDTSLCYVQEHFKSSGEMTGHEGRVTPV